MSKSQSPESTPPFTTAGSPSPPSQRARHRLDADLYARKVRESDARAEHLQRRMSVAFFRVALQSLGESRVVVHWLGLELDTFLHRSPSGVRAGLRAGDTFGGSSATPVTHGLLSARAAQER
jgi:hypothetical protein